MTEDIVPLRREMGRMAGVDPGEIHIAAATDTGQVLVVSDRHVRACKCLRNKRHSLYQKLLAHLALDVARW